MSEPSLTHFQSLLIGKSLFGLTENPSDVISKCALYFRAGKKGEWLYKQNDSPDFLFIGLDVEIEFSTGPQGAQRVVSNLSPGRVAHLYSFLFKQILPASARLKDSGHLLQIPRAVMDDIFANDKMLLLHLQRSVKSLDYRNIAKQFQNLGTQARFSIEFLKCVQEFELPPQRWLVQSGEVPEATYYITQGSVQSGRDTYTPSQKKGAFLIPQKTWVLFDDCEQERPTHRSFRNLDTIRGYKISGTDIKSICQKWPEDYLKLKKWLITSTSSNQVDSESEDEFVDLNQFFKETIDYKRKSWKSFPWVQQNDAMDCGPACLAMIAKYYEKNLPIQYWRTQLSTDKDGTTLFDLANTSERNGFVTQAIGIEDLSELDSTYFPAIVIRKYHYLVLYKMDQKFVTLGDPGVGVIKMSYEEFYDGFENAVLYLRPKPEFFQLEESNSSYRHFFKLFDGLSTEICLMALCSFLIMFLSLFPPIFMQVLLDEVLSKKDTKLLFYAVGSAIVISAVLVLLNWARSYYISYISTKFDFKAKSLFFNKMLSLKYHFFSTRHVGDFTRRLNELERVRQFMTGNVFRLLLNLSTVGLYLVAIFFYQPRLAVILVLSSPPFLLISMAFTRRMIRSYSEIFAKHSESDALLIDLVKAIGTIKALGAELSSRWRYEEKLLRMLQARYAFNITANLSMNLTGLYHSAVKYSSIGYAVYLGVAGELTPGQVIAISMIISQIIDPLNSLAGEWSELQEIKSVLGRLNDVFISESEVGIKSRGIQANQIQGDIEFKDVWFRYGGESSEWVLKGVSFKITAGMNVAIVGPSGSGKSTVAALIGRFYEPQRGQIFIDGRDIREYELTGLRKKVGLFLQDPNLFYGSAVENISFNEPEVDLTRMKKAAELAHADVFISSKPSGYDTIIAHGGLGLSGGEKQRLALARLFYQNPDVFILDEATAALDGIAEQKLLQNLKNISEDKTIVNIAHRYSTVKFSDFVILMVEGRVAKFGTHDELKLESDVYAQLFGFSKTQDEKIAS